MTQLPNKHNSIWNRLKQWANHHIFIGPKNMFLSLAVLTLCIVFLLAAILFFFNGDDLFTAFWDTLSTTINAWMPTSEDGSPLYIIIMAVGALFGILFTSILIGIMSTAIENKIEELNQGNTPIVEEGHIVILGLHTGLYRLLKELFATAGPHQQTIVIAGDEERLEMITKIKENIDIPSHIKIRYRKVDVCDPVDLQILSLPTASKVIMNHGSDRISLKCILAIKSITSAYQKRPSIVAIIHSNDYIAPFKEAGKGHVMLTLQSYELIARLIAHTCIKPGLSFVYEELFCSDGVDFYYQSIPELVGRTFKEITAMLDGAIPVGFSNRRRVNLNPSNDTVYQKDDQLVYLAEKKDSYRLTDETIDDITFPKRSITKEIKKNVFIIGQDSKMERICQELSSAECSLTHVFDLEELTYEDLKKKCKNIDHIILLGGKEETQLSDDRIIKYILTLQAVRKECNADFNITATMTDEKNKALIEDHHMDFIIASDFSNMVIAQLVDSPKRLPVFKELLSTKGNEIYTLPCAQFFREETVLTGKDLRLLGREYGYIVIGVRTKQSVHYMLDQLHQSFTISPSDDLMVISPSL